MTRRRLPPTCVLSTILAVTVAASGCGGGEWLRLLAEQSTAPASYGATSTGSQAQGCVTLLGAETVGDVIAIGGIELTVDNQCGEFIVCNLEVHLQFQGCSDHQIVKASFSEGRDTDMALYSTYDCDVLSQGRPHTWRIGAWECH